MFNGEIRGGAISPKSSLATHIPKENGVRWQLFLDLCLHQDLAFSLLGLSPSEDKCERQQKIMESCNGLCWKRP